MSNHGPTTMRGMFARLGTGVCIVLCYLLLMIGCFGAAGPQS